MTIAIPDSTRTNPVSRVAKIATRVQKELPNQNQIKTPCPLGAMIALMGNTRTNTPGQPASRVEGGKKVKALRNRANLLGAKIVLMGNTRTNTPGQPANRVERGKKAQAMQNRANPLGAPTVFLGNTPMPPVSRAANGVGRARKDRAMPNRVNQLRA